MLELKLNEEYIRQANSNSHFNAGDGIVAEAKNTFTAFYKRFGAYLAGSQKQKEFDSNFTEDLNEEQKAYLLEREAKWKQLVETAYNDELRRRASFVPVTVAGPARYDSKKMNKRVDKMMQAASDWHEKMNAFLENTEKQLQNLASLEKVLEDYRNGVNPDPISSDDPNAREKLEAKLEYLKKRHEQMKEANKQAKKEKKAPPFADYKISYARADIKRYEKRLEQIKKLAEDQNLKDFSFEGGKVVANYDAVRVQIFFDEKPGEEIIARLKSRGFHWAPSIKAWQRKLNNRAYEDARWILGING